jgi:MFS family permease
VAILFLVNGFLAATWASRIPAVKHSLGLNQAELGLVLLGSAIGALIAMYLTGSLAARFGSRPVVTIATICLCLVLPFVGLAPHPVVLFGALLLFGATLGSMDVAMNTQAVEVERQYRRPILTSFHGMYSLGGLLGALAGGAAAAVGLVPAGNFAVAAGIGLVAAMSVAAWLLPSTPDISSSAFSIRLPSRDLLRIGLVAFCTVVGEGAMADWSAVYLRYFTGSTAGVAALGFGAFSLLMAVSRFRGDRLTSRFGPVNMVRAGGLLSASGMLLAVLVPMSVPAIAGFALTGIGFAAIFPIAISAAGRAGPIPGQAIAMVATCGYVGFLAGPPVIGFVSQATNLRVGLGVVVVTSLISVVFAGSVRPGDAQHVMPTGYAQVEPF